MKIESVGAVLLFSDAPEALVAFYRDKLELPFEEEKHPGAILHYGCMIGDTHLAIHHSRVNRGKAGIAYALTVPAIDDFLRALGEKGTTPLHPPIAMGNGASRVTINDPDGNVVSLVRPSPAWRRR